MARRKKGAVVDPGAVAPVYRHLHARAVATINRYEDPSFRETYGKFVAEGLARPLTELLRPHQARVAACERREPITVARFEISRWFKDLPDNVWSFTLYPDGTGGLNLSDSIGNY